MKNTTFFKLFLVTLLSSLLLSSCWNNKDNQVLESWTWTGVIEKWIIELDNDNKKIESIDNTSLSDKFNSDSIWNLKCIIHTEEWWIFDQTVFISWKKMRMDSISVSTGVSLDTHMISNWEYTYIWWTGWNFKMKIDKNNVNKNENEKMDSWLTDTKEVLGKISTNKCEKWDVDDKVFELPEWVEFMDFWELQKSMKINIPKLPQ